MGLHLISKQALEQANALSIHVNDLMDSGKPANIIKAHHITTAVNSILLGVLIFELLEDEGGVQGPLYLGPVGRLN